MKNIIKEIQKHKTTLKDTIHSQHHQKVKEKLFTKNAFVNKN